MRYPTDHKQKTHARILREAGRLFRARGYKGCGVDDVMKAAGLTPGGFYAHFDSKEALLAEMLAGAIEQTRDQLLQGLDKTEGVEWLQKVVKRYLTSTHRDAVATGCALPSLISELTRMGDEGQQQFEAYLLELVSEMEEKMPRGLGLDGVDRVLATLALFVGGLSLARAVADPALSARILAACRRLAVPEAAARTGRGKQSTG